MNELPIIISCVIIIQLNKDGDDDAGEHRKLNVLFVKNIFTHSCCSAHYLYMKGTTTATAEKE
jgi:hypothetical protein